MSEYRRPGLPPMLYRDEHGLPIDYGRRWGGESPPGDAYSRTSNLQRFAPLHAVAAALVEWLRDTFDVAVEDTPDAANDLLRPPEHVVRAVRLRPRVSTAAPLTFVFTAFPGLRLHAGALHDFSFPVCGCDACDDDITDVVESLEWTVRTIISGGYGEQCDP